MNLLRLCLSMLIASAAFVSSGCGFRIGPTVETRTVIVHPGQPLRILQNVTVTGTRLGDDVQVEQDIGGWVCMPRDHFDELARRAGLQPITSLGTQP